MVEKCIIFKYNHLNKSRFVLERNMWNENMNRFISFKSKWNL